MLVYASIIELRTAVRLMVPAEAVYTMPRALKVFFFSISAQRILI